MPLRAGVPCYAQSLRDKVPDRHFLISSETAPGRKFEGLVEVEQVKKMRSVLVRAGM